MGRVAGVVLVLLLCACSSKSSGGSSETRPGLAAYERAADAIERTRASAIGLANALAELRAGDERLPEGADAIEALSVEPLDRLAVVELARALDADSAGEVLALAVAADRTEALRTELVTALRRDAKELALAKTRRESARPPEGLARHGIILQPAGANPPFGAAVVELGAPLCGGKVADGPCTDAPMTGFRYRTSPTEPWQSAAIAVPEPGASSLPTGRLIPIVPTGVWDELLATSPSSAAELLLQRQLSELMELANETTQQATALASLVQAASPTVE